MSSSLINGRWEKNESDWAAGGFNSSLVIACLKSGLALLAGLLAGAMRLGEKSGFKKSRTSGAANRVNVIERPATHEELRLSAIPVESCVT